MKKSINNFSRMLCAFMLCAGLVMTSCEGEEPIGNEGTEQNGNENGGGDNTGGDENGEGENNSKGPLTWSLDNITEVSATFTGRLDVPAADLSFSKVMVYYSDAEVFNVNDARKTSTTTFDSDQKFSITLTGLTPNVKYNFCLIAEVKSEQIYGDIKDFTTASLAAPTLNEASDVNYCKAIISGKLNNLAESISGVKYGIQYCTSENFASNVLDRQISEFDTEDKFSVTISSLTSLTTYYYRAYISGYDVTVYCEPKSFQTLQSPYDIPQDLNVASARDLSSSDAANCYIVSESGLYKFKTVKGNSTTSVGSVFSASILWETFGTDTAPNATEIVAGVCYQDGYIAFQTADTFKEGNAVIAAKDASGSILWSWHIWLTDQPQAQVYNNNAGTMMDRNLGATSATPGDVGALGLLYQWGRKDPFLGSSSISSSALAKSTIAWPSAVSSDSSNGTIEFATANPTTFITDNSNNYDWYYTGSSSTDNTRWTTSETAKSIYDPCPSGWRVPDGGANGVWSKALVFSSRFDHTYSSSNEGMNFSGKFGSDQTIWYPASGCRGSHDGSLYNVGTYGYYWSASPLSYYAYYLGFYDDGRVLPSDDNSRADGQSVRCLRESK